MAPRGVFCTKGGGIAICLRGVVWADVIPWCEYISCTWTCGGVVCRSEVAGEGNIPFEFEGGERVETRVASVRRGESIGCLRLAISRNKALPQIASNATEREFVLSEELGGYLARNCTVGS